MSTIRIKKRCPLCEKPLGVGPAIYVKYCELSDANYDRNERFKDEYRVVWKGKSKGKVEGAIHIGCWGELVFTKEQSKIRAAIATKDRLSSIE